VTVDLDDGAVDHGELHVWIIRHGFENSLENIRLYPVPVALEDGVSTAKGSRQVTPRAAGARNPQHRFKTHPVVPAGAAGIGWLAKAMRLHLCPLSITQTCANHPKLPFGSLNHISPDEGILNLNSP
jgi:hypothetical protein